VRGKGRAAESGGAGGMGEAAWQCCRAVEGTGLWSLRRGMKRAKSLLVKVGTSNRPMG